MDFEDLTAGTSAQLHDADVLKLLEAQDRSYFRSGYRYSNSGCVLWR